MSFNELSRRELQTMCKEYGLPANKTNAAMASSLTTFLGDPRTNVLARAPHFLNPVVPKNSSRAKALPKIEMQETSLAALILAARPSDLDRQGKVVKKGRDVQDGRNIKADLSAFIVTAPARTDADCMFTKTTPLLRRRNTEAIPPTVAEEMISSSDFAEELEGQIQVIGELYPMKKQSTREPQLVLDLNAAALESCNEGSKTLYQQDVADFSPELQLEDVRQITSNEFKPVASPSARDQGQDIADFSPELQVEDVRQITSNEFELVASSSARDQDHQTRKCCRNFVQPALSHVFRITADVDKLINRTTAMLEKFQAWKEDLPQGHGTDIAVGS